MQSRKLETQSRPTPKLIRFGVISFLDAWPTVRSKFAFCFMGDLAGQHLQHPELELPAGPAHSGDAAGNDHEIAAAVHYQLLSTNGPELWGAGTSRKLRRLHIFDARLRRPAHTATLLQASTCRIPNSKPRCNRSNPAQSPFSSMSRDTSCIASVNAHRSHRSRWISLCQVAVDGSLSLDGDDCPCKEQSETVKVGFAVQ